MATAGIVIEPVLGEGGILTVSRPFLRALRALCDEAGLLLILDEIQTGMGRTGKLFAHEWAGIEPDIMVTGKGIGGGLYPIACTLIGEHCGGWLTEDGFGHMGHWFGFETHRWGRNRAAPRKRLSECPN